MGQMSIANRHIAINLLQVCEKYTVNDKIPGNHGKSDILTVKPEHQIEILSTVRRMVDEVC